MFYIRFCPSGCLFRKLLLKPQHQRTCSLLNLQQTLNSPLNPPFSTWNHPDENTEPLSLSLCLSLSYFYTFFFALVSQKTNYFWKLSRGWRNGSTKSREFCVICREKIKHWEVKHKEEHHRSPAAKKSLRLTGERRVCFLSPLPSVEPDAANQMSYTRPGPEGQEGSHLSSSLLLEQKDFKLEHRRMLTFQKTVKKNKIWQKNSQFFDHFRLILADRLFKLIKKHI